MALGAFLAGMVVGRSEVQPACRVRGAAAARRLRRAVLRLGRDAARPDVPVRDAAAGRGNARGGDRGQAPGGDGRRGLVAVSGPRGLCRGGRAGADRRVLVHPGCDGAGAGRAATGGDEHDRGRRDRLDRAESAALPRAAGRRAMGVRAAAPLAIPQRPCDARRRGRQLVARPPGASSHAPRGCHRLRSDGPYPDAPAARQRHCADRGRAQHGHGAAVARGGRGRGVRRWQSPRGAGGRRHRRVAGA